MRTLGNILWFIFGGLILSVLWGVVGIICCCTIIAVPAGIQCFKFASFVFWPFGRDVVFSNNVGSFLLKAPQTRSSSYPLFRQRHLPDRPIPHTGRGLLRAHGLRGKGASCPVYRVYGPGLQGQRDGDLPRFSGRGRKAGQSGDVSEF